VSLQVAILKVLESYPDGRATVAAMKADLAILAGAGPAWNERLKRLAASVPDLDIFSRRFVLRDNFGWQLTAAGREALHAMELPRPAAAAPPATAPPPRLEIVASAPLHEQAFLAVKVIGVTERRRRRAV
jgi:hypothetical protein